MRIGVILDFADRFGGAQRFASWLIDALNSLGHEIACISLTNPKQGTSYKEFFCVEKWFTPSFIFPPIGKLYQLLITLGHLVRDCDQYFKPTVMINTAPFPPLLLGVRAVKIQYVHYPFELSLLKKDNVLFKAYRRPIWYFNERALRKIDFFVVNSHYTKLSTIDVWGGIISEDKIQVINPTAIDITKYRVNIPREMKVCYIGRIDPMKGIQKVIEAFEVANVPGSKLVIAGGVDSRRSSLELYLRLKKIAENSEGRIEVIPNPTDNEIIEIYASSRAFANFFFEEHFGIVPVEAMAAGTPPIVAKGGGQVETIIDGKTGFLVSSLDEMADRIRLLLVDDSLFNRMSEEATKHVITNFSRNVFVEKWKEVLSRYEAK